MPSSADATSTLYPRSAAEPVAQLGEAAWVGERNLGIDAGRVLAALFVIWVHTTANVELDGVAHHQIGFVGVPFFTAAAVLFTTQRVFRGTGTPAMLATSIKRILWPFVVWATIYFVASYIVSGWLLGGVRPSLTFTDVITGAGGWHLWFLPYIFAVGLAAMALASVARRSVVASIAVMLGAGGACVWLLLAYDPSPSAVARSGLRRWPFEAPVALAALVIGLGIFRGWIVMPRRVAVSAVFWLCFAAVIVVGLFDAGDWARRLAQLAGVLMLLGCLTWPSALVPGALGRLGSLGYGVYVVHYLFVLALLRVTERDGVVSPAEGLASFAIVAVCSFLSVWLVRKLPMVRRLLP